MTKTTDSKISNLKPGQSVVISSNGTTTVTAERTANGKTIKFVRSTGDKWEVFHTVRR